MQLVQWTLFIDMLGYRDINGEINSDETAEEFIDFMETNKKLLDLTDSPEVKERYAKEGFDLYKYYDISTAFISDSLVITYKPKSVEEPDGERRKYMHSANALFIIVMRLQAFLFHCFKEKGLFLRGGISNKYCYVKDSFVVGEGLIEAYAAESSIAKHPRIILHPNVEENRQLMSAIEFLAKLMYQGRSILQRDPEDRVLFLDYLGYAICSTSLEIPMVAQAAIRNPPAYAAHRQSSHDYVRRHAEALQKKISDLEVKLQAAQHESEEKRLRAVLAKFIWLKSYHNEKTSLDKEYVKYAIQ